ncbi:nucleoporin 88 [Papilio machaon]|uniref:nucleoporin 88 n=1 Tax=Papilio machaon TaxID=76193 RepID=UPI001E662C89|nr:nucleoporin 88 [Papilio machaon]
MDTKLYDTILPKHKMFEDIKKSLQENTGAKLYNFIELKDDVLYIWNSVENCLFCLNLKHLEEHPDNTPYQRLQLLSPPEFNVERVVGSACGGRLCAYGARGATLVDLPARWGRAGLFDNGNQTVLCKSVSLDERFLFSQGEIRRVQWHPSSLSHILVLMSDNTIRLYNIALKSGPKLVKSIPVGLKPSSQLAGRNILDSLGDTAVDFTPLPNTDSLLILRGDGEVYMVQCTLDSKGPLQPRLWGPLPIYPPADDNYGSESCSICVLGAGDTLLVVIATCSAALYHCLLLPAPPEDGDDRSGYALYVVESVELNLNLSSEDGEFSHSYPVHLYPCTSNTYACVHMGGVHTVSLPILDKLKDYAAADETNAESALSAICTHSSSAQHAVSWRRAGCGAAAVRGPRPLLLLLAPDGALLTRYIHTQTDRQTYHMLLAACWMWRCSSAGTSPSAAAASTRRCATHQVHTHTDRQTDISHAAGGVLDVVLQQCGDLALCCCSVRGPRPLLLLLAPDGALLTRYIHTQTDRQTYHMLLAACWMWRCSSAGTSPSAAAASTRRCATHQVHTHTDRQTYHMLLAACWMWCCSSAGTSPSAAAASTRRCATHQVHTHTDRQTYHMLLAACWMWCCSSAGSSPSAAAASTRRCATHQVHTHTDRQTYHMLLAACWMWCCSSAGTSPSAAAASTRRCATHQVHTHTDRQTYHMLLAACWMWRCSSAGTSPSAAAASTRRCATHQHPTVRYSPGTYTHRQTDRHITCCWRRAGCGAAAVRGPRPLLLLLAPDGALLTRSLEPYELEERLYREIQLRNPNLEPDDLNKLLKEKQKLSFVTIVQEILAREASQPLLHLRRSESDQPSPKDCLELLTQATLLLRKEYMSRQSRAGSALARKSAALSSLANNFLNWRNTISVEMDGIVERGRLLQQKCALAEQQQEDLKYRCSVVSRRVRAGSVRSGEERELCAELERYRRGADALAHQIHALNKHAQHKAEELRRWHEEYKRKETALGKTHSDTISSVLQQQTSQISSLIEETKLLKDQLSIV